MAIGFPSETLEVDDSCHRPYQKGVRHLCDTGITSVPNKYVLPVSERPSREPEPHMKKKDEVVMKLPVIDLSKLHGSNRPAVLKLIAKACVEPGFFQVINHGVPTELTSSMTDVSQRFFNLPFEEREKYMTSDMRTAVRYGTSFNQNKDGVFCWRDFLKLHCHPLQEFLPLWPDAPFDLRQVGMSYVKQTRSLFFMLMEAVLESLGLDRSEGEIILKDFEEGSQMMVMNCYPWCPEPELTLGMPAHSDYGFLTLLLQDQVPGLQVQYQGRWVTVEPLPNSFTVNVGDHLEIFSNGRYKSVLHRVLVNSSKSRISVASLHGLPFDRVVRPAPQLVNDENPPAYLDTDFAAFLNYVSSCEPKGKSFLHSRKLNKNEN